LKSSDDENNVPKLTKQYSAMDDIDEDPPGDDTVTTSTTGNNIATSGSFPIETHNNSDDSYNKEFSDNRQENINKQQPSYFRASSGYDFGQHIEDTKKRKNTVSILFSKESVEIGDFHDYNAASKASQEQYSLNEYEANETSPGVRNGANTQHPATSSSLDIEIVIDNCHFSANSLLKRIHLWELFQQSESGIVPCQTIREALQEIENDEAKQLLVTLPYLPVEGCAWPDVMKHLQYCERNDENNAINETEVTVTINAKTIDENFTMRMPLSDWPLQAAHQVSSIKNEIIRL
jgi:hypothetical protein